MIILLDSRSADLTILACSYVQSEGEGERARGGTAGVGADHCGRGADPPELAQVPQVHPHRGGCRRLVRDHGVAEAVVRQ